MQCTECGVQPKSPPKETKAGNLRLPRGWKRDGERVLCGPCVDASYRLCAVTLPVAGPVSCDWPTLREILAGAWSESTRLANWLMGEFYARDVRRQPGMEKLPKWEKPYLYPETATFGVSSQARASMEQAIAGKYRAARYQIIWSGEQSVANFRYPYPYPVPGQAWTVRMVAGEDGKSEWPEVSIALPGGRVVLRLRSGRDFRRQVAAVRQIAAGEAIPGELAIYRQRVRESDGRNGMSSNSDGRPQYRIMVKMVARLPRPKRQAAANNTLYVRTDCDSILLALDADNRRLHQWSGDDVRGWIYQHQRWLQRRADDSKAERRKPKRRRRRLLVDYDDRCRKFRSRMKTWIDSRAAEIVGLAVRRKCGTIAYDDSDHGFISSFPWSQLRAAIAGKCDADSVRFVHASGTVPAETLAALAGPEA